MTDETKTTLCELKRELRSRLADFETHRIETGTPPPGPLFPGDLRPWRLHDIPPKYKFPTWRAVNDGGAGPHLHIVTIHIALIGQAEDDLHIGWSNGDGNETEGAPGEVRVERRLFKYQAAGRRVSVAAGQMAAAALRHLEPDGFQD